MRELLLIFINEAAKPGTCAMNIYAGLSFTYMCFQTEDEVGTDVLALNRLMPDLLSETS